MTLTNSTVRSTFHTVTVQEIEDNDVSSLPLILERKFVRVKKRDEKGNFRAEYSFFKKTRFHEHVRITTTVSNYLTRNRIIVFSKEEKHLLR